MLVERELIRATTAIHPLHNHKGDQLCGAISIILIKEEIRTESLSDSVKRR